MSLRDDNPRRATAQAGPALSRRAFVGLTGLAGAGLVTGCSSGLKSSASSATGTIKIGFVSPVTGPDAAFATANPFVLKKVREAFAKGLTIGGKKYRVEIVTADSQSSDSRAAQVAQQLITQDNVDIMLTTSAPETVNPVSDQCEAAHVPCIGTIVPWQSWFLGRGGKIGATAATSTSFKYTYLYFIGLEDELAAQGPGWKMIRSNHKVGGLWPSDADGQAFRGAFTKALPKEGFKVFDPGPYSDGTHRLHLDHQQVQGAELRDRHWLPAAARLPHVLEAVQPDRLPAADRRDRQGHPVPQRGQRAGAAGQEPGHRRVVDPDHAVEVLARPG